MLQYSDGTCTDRKRKTSLAEFIVSIIICLVGGILFVLVGIRGVIHAQWYGGLFILTGVFMMILWRWFWLQFATKYKVCTEGIAIKYPLEKNKMVFWEEFQEVCICYAYNQIGQSQRAAFVIICCVKHGEEKNGLGRWKIINPFRFRTVITMDYTDELYYEIKEKCPYKIKDLRETSAYRLQFNYKF